METNHKDAVQVLIKDAQDNLGWDAQETSAKLKMAEMHAADAQEEQGLPRQPLLGDFFVSALVNIVATEKLLKAQ